MPTALGQTRGDGSTAAWLHNLGVWIWWHVVAWPIAEPVDKGAASVIFAALSPTLNGMTFAYIRHCQQAAPAAPAQNATAAAFLWRESERLYVNASSRRSRKLHGIEKL